MTFQELKIRVRIAPYEQAVEIITQYISIHPADDDALTLRGMKHWGAGKRSLAINDYLAALRLNPLSRARQALEAADEILDYRCKDLYNP